MQLHREYPRIKRRGAELVLIGNGSRHFARAFRDEHAITAPLYVDPERRAYAALGMVRGARSASGVLRTLRNASRAWGEGFRQGPVQGDAWQLGGVLVVRPGGRISYRHLSAAAGDHPDTADLLAALEGVKRASP